MLTGMPTVGDPGAEVVRYHDDLLGISQSSRAENVAIVTAGDTLTFAELDRAVNERASRWGTGRRVEVMAPANDLDGLVDYLGALRAGRVPLLSPDTGTHQAYQGETEVHPELALLMATSGSTGTPRVVRLSRRNVVSNARAIATVLDLGPTSRGLTSLPTTYCFGLSVVHSHLTVGGAVVLTSASVTDAGFGDLMRDAGVTALCGVPHTFALLDAIGFEDLDLADLRIVAQAGGRLSPADVTRWRALGGRRGWEFRVMYGQTEATARMSCQRPGDPDHTVGRAIPGGSFRIDEPVDGIGEVVYRGPNVMMGYADGPDRLARGPEHTELFTGDRGHLENGRLVIDGRLRRVAKPFGVRVDLDAVDATLADAGLRTASVEIPTERSSTTRIRVAVERPATARQVRRALSGGPAVPAPALEIVVVEALPLLASDKVDHLAIAHLEAPAPDDDIVEVMAAAVGLDAADVESTDSFVSLGGDSLGFVQCSIGLERHLGHLPADWHLLTIEELAAAGRPPRRRGASIDVGVVLRAVAITAIVSRHVRLLDTGWGAHALLALCGLNVGRFQLHDPDSSSRRLLRSAGRLALPAVAWLAVVVALDRSYDVANVFLVNNLVGSPHWGPPWRYWFIETLVQILLVVAALFSIPAVRRLDRRAPFATAVGATVIGLVLRADVLGLVPVERRLNHPLTTVWLFALGWAIWRADTTRQRVMATVLVAVTGAGYFGDLRRDLIVIAMLWATVWIPTIRLPRPLIAPISTVASASLFIYLTHWQVYPHLLGTVGPVVSLAASLAVGIAVWTCWDRVIVPLLPDWRHS